jgi:hypothetical protein
MTPDAPVGPTTDSHDADPPGSAPWLVVSRPTPAPDGPPPSAGRMLLTIGASTVIVLVVVALVGVLAARKHAER